MSIKLSRLRLTLAALLAFSLSLAAPHLFAQAAGQRTGSIHGTVTDPTGAPVPGTVSLYPGGLTSPTQTPRYTFPVDNDGQYHGSGIAPGSYTATFRQPNTPKDKVVDQFDNVKIVAGQDTQQDFDMSRAAYLARMTPEQRKQIEEIKKKNAAITQENARIRNLNGDLHTARADDASGNFAGAVALMQKDVAIMPNASVLWVELGIAQRGAKQWSDAITSLRKGIAIEKASKSPHPDLLGSAENSLGESLANEGKYADAMAAYDAAAQDNPPQAGVYYTNDAIMMDRFGQIDNTVTAADKAIAANPNDAIAYYLKGKALINKATVDPKTQKILAPPGCVEAYQKYLQLAPNGQFANDAKAVIQEMGQTQSTSYATSKKRRH